MVNVSVVNLIWYDIVHQQLIGIAMGMAAAPPIANIYVGIYEISHILKFQQKLHYLSSSVLFSLDISVAINAFLFRPSWLGVHFKAKFELSDSLLRAADLFM